MPAFTHCQEPPGPVHCQGPGRVIQRQEPGRVHHHCSVGLDDGDFAQVMEHAVYHDVQVCVTKSILLSLGDTVQAVCCLGAGDRVQDQAQGNLKLKILE